MNQSMIFGKLSEQECLSIYRGYMGNDQYLRFDLINFSKKFQPSTFELNLINNLFTREYYFREMDQIGVLPGLAQRPNVVLTTYMKDREPLKLDDNSETVVCKTEMVFIPDIKKFIVKEEQVKFNAIMEKYNNNHNNAEWFEFRLLKQWIPKTMKQFVLLHNVYTIEENKTSRCLLIPNDLFEQSTGFKPQKDFIYPNFQELITPSLLKRFRNDIDWDYNDEWRNVELKDDHHRGFPRTSIPVLQ